MGCTGLCHKTMALIALSEISLLTSLLSLAPLFSLGFIWGTMSVIILGLLFAFFFFPFLLAQVKAHSQSPGTPPAL